MTLSCEQGSFCYAGGDTVLRDIHFSANAGDLVAILGPNGAGKTTLLRCLMGFLRWTSGRSTLDGADIRTLTPRTLWQSLAYVPQARYAAVSYTAEEMVLLGRSSRIGALAQPSALDLDAAHAVMNTLHILPLCQKKCTEISGGELQMVLIARALAAQPRVLILDEPESNLDFKNQLLILETLSRLVADGMTCLFNTHYPAHALQRANKALLLSKDGRALFGDTNAVVTEETIERTFGVKAVIGEVETRGNILQSVVPVSVSAEAAGGGVTGTLSAESAARVAGVTNASTTTSGANTAGAAGAMHATAATSAPPAQSNIAVISIIASDFSVADKINSYLHIYKDCLIGRMGMPYQSSGVFVITVTLDAPEYRVRTLAQQLSNLPSVSVKTTFAPELSPTNQNAVTAQTEGFIL